jgi:hypothetical protein
MYELQLIGHKSIYIYIWELVSKKIYIGELSNEREY